MKTFFLFCAIFRIVCAINYNITNILPRDAKILTFQNDQIICTSKTNNCNGIIGPIICKYETTQLDEYGFEDDLFNCKPDLIKDNWVLVSHKINCHGKMMTLEHDNLCKIYINAISPNNHNVIEHKETISKLYTIQFIFLILVFIIGFLFWLSTLQKTKRFYERCSSFWYE